MAEKDLVIILISSLPGDYNFLITALETIAEEKLTWDCVRDRLFMSMKRCKGEVPRKSEVIFPRIHYSA